MIVFFILLFFLLCNANDDPAVATGRPRPQSENAKTRKTESQLSMPETTSAFAPRNTSTFAASSTSKSVFRSRHKTTSLLDAEIVTSTNAEVTTKEDEKPHKRTTLRPTTSSGSTVAYEKRIRCQDPQTLEFVSSATTCKNERADRICALIFDAPDPKTGKRDPRCNVNGQPKKKRERKTSALSGMEDIADSCRRQCGICCEHIDYACEDDENQIIDCTKQLDKCAMLKWFDVLARFCAGSCGLCTRTECRDYTHKCREQKHLCLDQNHIDEMRTKCARTCGFCVVGPGGISESEFVSHKLKSTSSDPLKRLPVPACIDQAANCTENESLCASPMHAEYMMWALLLSLFDFLQVVVPVITNGSPELNGTAAVLLPASVIMNAAKKMDKCEDNHPKCAIWVAKGFCTHERYTVEQRMALCPKSLQNQLLDRIKERFRSSIITVVKKCQPRSLLENGNWRVESENFEAFVKHMGLEALLEKYGGKVEPMVEIKVDGKKWEISVLTATKEIHLEFELGVEFEEESLDGRKLKVILGLK
ncbi:Fatty acid-binding protein-like protein 5 [Aphelenchoides besseyi]|nr:Fatty acid-binding protein-like protein 5 [Aphelenchoides besseyi]